MALFLEKDFFDVLALAGGVGLATGLVGGAYYGLVPVADMSSSNNWGSYNSKSTAWGTASPTLFESYVIAGQDFKTNIEMRLTFMFDLPGDDLAANDTAWFNMSSKTATELGYPPKTLAGFPLSYWMTAALVIGVAGRGGIWLM